MNSEEERRDGERDDGKEEDRGMREKCRRTVFRKSKYIGKENRKA